ncbi:MAG: CDP-glycerol glycerophosphotransferase family protein, partial [Turicibacter sp.]|nr:CDP-glycerol glycerophosphotransferase family protein [Turicibacter sp.]
YNMKERRPDAIFLFNPYDDMNFVTSIHPDFYCKTLREHTDMLIYSAYTPDFDSVPHNRLGSNGYLMTDRIILASESTTKNTIAAMKKMYGANMPNVEKKFLHFGSPKIDKVVNSKRENFSLPAQWQNIVKGKKVVMYNSSIVTLLPNNEKHLDKMQHVFDTFKKHKDIALWWRPHPLLESTIKSMRPWLLPRYKKMIADFKAQNIGIFDDTADLHRALAYADALYTDASSVPSLYRATGKPAMRSTLMAVEKNLLFLYWIYVTETDIWFSPQTINGLFRLDKTTEKIEFMGFFEGVPKYDQTKHTPYFQPVKSGDCLYFPPFYSLFSNESCILKYDINERKFTAISLNLPYVPEILVCFGCVFVYENYVFLTPERYPAIIRLDTQTGEIKLFNDWCREMVIGVPLAFGGACQHGNTIWLPFSFTNIVMSFDMKTCKTKLYRVGSKDYKYGNIVSDGEYFWIVPKSNTKGALIKWHPTKGTKEFSGIYDQNPYYKLLYTDGYVWLLPFEEGAAYKIDVKTNEKSVVHEFEINRDNLYQFTLDYHVYSGTIYNYNHAKQSIQEYKNGEIRNIKIELPNVKYTPFPANPDNMDNMYRTPYFEDEYYHTLDNFLDYVAEDLDSTEEHARAAKQRQLIAENAYNVDGTAGKRIYEHIKGEILKESGRK